MSSQVINFTETLTVEDGDWLYIQLAAGGVGSDRKVTAESLANYTLNANVALNANITLQGNTFNGPSQLLQLGADGFANTTLLGNGTPTGNTVLLGNGTWGEAIFTGNGTPGGSTPQMQYRDGSNFAGTPMLQYDDTATQLTIRDVSGNFPLWTANGTTNITVAHETATGDEMLELDHDATTFKLNDVTGSEPILLANCTSGDISIGYATADPILTINGTSKQFDIRQLASPFFVFSCNFTTGNLSFFAKAPLVGQQVANQNMTDSTTGSAGTTLNNCTGSDTVDESTINDNFASINARLNEIRALIINLGLGA